MSDEEAAKLIKDRARRNPPCPTVNVLKYIDGEYHMEIIWSTVTIRTETVPDVGYDAFTKYVPGSVGKTYTTSRRVCVKNPAPPPGFKPPPIDPDDPEDGYTCHDEEVVNTPVTYAKLEFHVIRNGIDTIVSVHDLRVVSRLNGIDEQPVAVSLADAAEDENYTNSIRVPLDMDVWSESGKGSELTMSLVATASFVLIINVHEVHTIKWYRRGLFQAIMMIVALVLAYFTGGATMVAWSAFFMIASHMATAIWGPSGGMIVAAIGAVFTMGQSLLSAAVNIANATINLAIELAKLVLSVIAKVLPAALSIYDIVASLLLEKDLEDIADEQEEIDAKMELWEEYYLEMKGLLRDDVNAFNYIGAIHFDSSETPDEFYNRTIHNPNLTYALIQQPSKYVENSLKLPEFDGNFNDPFRA